MITYTYIATLTADVPLCTCGKVPIYSHMMWRLSLNQPSLSQILITHTVSCTPSPPTASKHLLFTPTAAEAFHDIG